MKTIIIILMIAVFLLAGCFPDMARTKPCFTGAPGEVKLMTLDPGHFHAALVQKSMYDQVSRTVYVYAPDGPDVREHLRRILGFNTRPVRPTTWVQNVYTGPDFLEAMLRERPGNVVVISGNNARKTDYILQTVKAGLNVLADKPMVITPEKFPMLVKAFKVAEHKGVLLYDIMTERYEITTILQKELAHIPEVFGELEKGTPDNPAITKESVHHFFKYVAGNPIKRPAWFFDVAQEGDGMVDVGTHLVDLIQWECFPGQILDYKKDIQMLAARRWPTALSLVEFQKVTSQETFPEFLNKDIKDGNLNVFCNGEMTYRIKGVHAKVSVTWKFQAPEGTGDTHYSIMRGSRCNLIIRQGKEQQYSPVLYVEANEGQAIDTALEKAVGQTLQATYPGVGLKATGQGTWEIVIPDKYKVGHEAHFAQVMQKYLGYLVEGKLPDWEVPNMITKYYTTTTALKMARE